MSLSVVIPTIAGREEHLQRTLRSFERTAPEAELIVLQDHPTCGEAWAVGARRARRELLMMAADDLEMLPGWLEAASAVVFAGMAPAPLIYHSNGLVQSCGGSWEAFEQHGAVTRYSRVPFLRRRWWFDFVEPFPTDMHYYTDDLVSWRLRERGVVPVICHGYRMFHHLAQEGRGAGMSERERMELDFERFKSCS